MNKSIYPTLKRIFRLFLALRSILRCPFQLNYPKLLFCSRSFGFLLLMQFSTPPSLTYPAVVTGQEPKWLSPYAQVISERFTTPRFALPPENGRFKSCHWFALLIVDVNTPLVERPASFSEANSILILAFRTIEQDKSKQILPWSMKSKRTFGFFDRSIRVRVLPWWSAGCRPAIRSNFEQLFYVADFCWRVILVYSFSRWRPTN